MMDGRSAIKRKVDSYLSKPRPFLIGARWVASSCGETFPVINPATEEVIAHVYEGRAEDIDRAVVAARAVFDDGKWRYMPPAERAKLLWRLADLIEANGEELSYLEVLNQGKPLALAQALDIPGVAETLRFYAGWCTKIEGATATISMPDQRRPGALGPAYHAYSVREPVGVVGAIVPWNFPLVMAIAKLAPALAAGCTAVLKPAEETPLTALRLGELILEAGVPAGVVNIVPGYGHIAGAALAAHPGVDKITFTGSTEIGRRIVQAATGNLKKVSLELGGKSPVIVLDDADIDRAIEGAAQAIFLNTGQVCFAGSRLIAQRKIFDRLVEGVTRVAKSIKLGPGLDASTEMGPLISSKQLARVCDYIGSGRMEGADVVTGGDRLPGKGYFVNPTVLVSDNPAIRVSREEIFGPVLVAHPVDDLAEIAHLANATDYGLAASIWTRDLSRAHGLASVIRAGSVWINCHNVVDEALPFGGYKQSGWGREGGRLGIDSFLEAKSVVVAL